MGTRMTMIAVKARAFPRSNRGNVAMMFAVATVPLTVAAGVGLDYSRAILVREQMSEALDAAALAVGSATCLTLSQAQTLAQEYFIANYTVDQTAFGNPSVTITARARSC
jgi:Flp pilus assembly protein TadG